MHVLPPSVGVLPQPTRYNDNKFNKLHAEAQPFRPSVSEDSPFAGGTCLRCDVCKQPFNLSEGYIFLDEFFCDACAWKLAEKGGLYNGH